MGNSQVKPVATFVNPLAKVTDDELFLELQKELDKQVVELKLSIIKLRSNATSEYIHRFIREDKKAVNLDNFAAIVNKYNRPYILMLGYIGTFEIYFVHLPQKSECQCQCLSS